MAKWLNHERTLTGQTKAQRDNLPVQLRGANYPVGVAGGSIARLIFGFSRVWARFLKEKGVFFMFYYSPKLDFFKRLGD